MQQNAISISSSGENYLAALEAFFDRKGPEIMSGAAISTIGVLMVSPLCATDILASHLLKNHAVPLGSSVPHHDFPGKVCLWIEARHVSIRT